MSERERSEFRLAEGITEWPERLTDALDQLDAFNAMINQERPGE